MKRIHVYRITIEPHWPEPQFSYWFSVVDDEEIIQANLPMIVGMIERHAGYVANAAYLILHPTHTFTINFDK